MSPPTAWRCVPAHARDIQSVMEAYRKQVHDLQSVHFTARRQSVSMEASSSASIARVQSGSQVDCDSDEGDGDDAWMETGSDAVSEEAEPDELDRMEDAAEAMRQTKPPRMCSHAGCEIPAAMKVGRGTGPVAAGFACMGHGLQPTVLLQLLRAVLSMDDRVVLQYIQEQQDDGEAFGERMDQAFSFFCAADEEELVSSAPTTDTDVCAGTSTWKHDAATIKALAHTMGVLLRGVKRDEGRRQLQLLLQQTPQLRNVALQVRERIHKLMLAHQEELELLLEEQECEADRVAITSKYIETEATEDVDMDAHEGAVDFAGDYEEVD